MSTDRDFIIKQDSSCKKIYLYAYLGNEKVVKIPDGVTHIGSFIFAKYSSAKTVKPNTTVEKIILPDSVRIIDNQAFAFCTALKEIYWPKVKRLALLGLVFRGCSSLTKLEIPECVKGMNLLYINDNLKELILHDSLDQLLPFNYESTMWSKKGYDITLTVETVLKNPVYQFIDGWIVNTKTQGLLFRVDRSKEEVVVPYGIKTINGYAFDEEFIDKTSFNDYLENEIVPIKKVVLPETVRKISAYAFKNCNELNSVEYLGNSNRLKISNNAFDKCGSFSKSGKGIICSDKKIGFEKRKTGSQLDRWLIIHNAIKSGMYPTAQKLLQLCAEANDGVIISKATFDRDIDTLRNTFFAPIEFDRKHHGYCYTDPDFELDLWNRGRLSADFM